MLRIPWLPPYQGLLEALVRSKVAPIVLYLLAVLAGYHAVVFAAAQLVVIGQPVKLLHSRLAARPEQVLQAGLVLAPREPGSLCLGDARFVAEDCPSLDGNRGHRIVVGDANLANILFMLREHGRSDGSTRYYMQAPPWMWSDAAVDAFGPLPDTQFLDARSHPKPSLVHVAAVLRTVALAAGYRKVENRPFAPVGRPSSLVNVGFVWPPKGFYAMSLATLVETKKLSKRLVWVTRRSWLPADTAPAFRQAFDEFSSRPSPAFALGEHRVLD